MTRSFFSRDFIAKIQASFACQASRVLYGSAVAILIWKETRGLSLGYWYGAVSWLTLIMFVDVGFTATAVDKLSHGDGPVDKGSRRQTVVALATAYYCIVTCAVFAVLSALWLSGKMPPDWRSCAAILVLASATLVTALNAFQISLLQAAGHWERSQYLPVIPYVIGAAIMGLGFYFGLYPIEAVAAGQLAFALGVTLLLRREMPDKVDGQVIFPNALKELWRIPHGLRSPEIRFYYSLMACAVLSRLAMFAASLREATIMVGEIGRLNQTLLTVISICFFPVNGLANRVIGDLRRGAHRQVVVSDMLRMFSTATAIALAGTISVLVVVNVHISWLAATRLLLGQQSLLGTALVLEALILAAVPILAFVSHGNYWRGSITIAILSGLPWLIYAVIPGINFFYTRIFVDLLVGAKVLLDYRASFGEEQRP